MAKYKFYYLISGSDVSKQKEYISSYNINEVIPYFLKDNLNVIKIDRIDILEDLEGINTDQALGYTKT